MVFIDRMINRGIIIKLEILTLKMPNVLQNISMFPFEDFWTIKGEKKISHRCGGILTLLAFLIIGSITLYEILLVAQRNTITTSVETQIDFQPPYANITTFQNNPTMEPYMIALDIKGGPDGAPSAQNYSVYAYHAIRFYNKSTEKFQSILSPILLQNCTEQHFSRLPNITGNLQNWGIDNWYCLPLNQTYQIGGNQIESSKQLRFGVTCINATDPACAGVSGMAMVTTLYTLNTFINPQNNSTPFLNFLNSRESVFQQNSFTRNFININKNILITDDSLTPLPSQRSHTSYEANNDFDSYSFNRSKPTTQFFIQRSQVTTVSHRSYLKILAALSFVGGLVAPIIGFFSLIFLTQNFGSLVFQMRFAQMYFHDKVGKIAAGFHYFRFVKQLFYNFLESINLKPDWQYIRKSDQIIRAVNNLMDVVYLHKRINFLQRAISVVLEKHQLKGLYLLNRATREEAEQIYKSHKLRVRVNRLLSSNQFDQRVRNWFRQRGQIKDFINNSLFKKNQNKPKEQIVQSMRKIESVEQQLPNGKKKEITKPLKNLQNQLSIKLDSSNKLISMQRLNQPQITDAQQNQEELQDQYDYELEPEVEPISQEEAEELLRDLTKLHTEAKKRGGDQRSKRIYDLLDKKIKKMLKNTDITPKND